MTSKTVHFVFLLVAIFLVTKMNFTSAYCTTNETECKLPEGLGYEHEEDYCPNGKDCPEEMETCLNFLGSVIKAKEPICKQNVSICREVCLSGLSTIAYHNKSCMEEDKENPGKTGPSYIQMVEVVFDVIKINCRLHETPQDAMRAMAEQSAEMAAGTFKDMGSKVTEMGGKIADAGKDVMGGIESGVKGLGFGKRSAYDDENAFFVEGNWQRLLVRLKMRIGFDDDTSEVLSAEVNSETWNGLFLCCRGKTFGAKLCEWFTYPCFIRWLFGWFTSFSIRKAISEALMDKEAAKYISNLNCGED